MVEAGALSVPDRGYLDFVRLSRIHPARGFFGSRAKRTFRFRYLDSRPADRTTRERSDQSIRLSGFDSRLGYPERLQRIRLSDVEKRQWLVFLSNSLFSLPALSIAQLHRCRRQVAPFFTWIKQHLGIKAFDGTSETAVKT